MIGRLVCKNCLHAKEAHKDRALPRGYGVRCSDCLEANGGVNIMRMSTGGSANICERYEPLEPEEGPMSKAEP